jgi:hypothetical protein
LKTFNQTLSDDFWLIHFKMEMCFSLQREYMCVYWISFYFFFSLFFLSWISSNSVGETPLNGGNKSLHDNSYLIDIL